MAALAGAADWGGRQVVKGVRRGEAGELLLALGAGLADGVRGRRGAPPALLAVAPAGAPAAGRARGAGLMSRALAAPRPDRSALWFWLFVICAELLVAPLAMRSPLYGIAFAAGIGALALLATFIGTRRGTVVIGAALVLMVVVIPGQVSLNYRIPVGGGGIEMSDLVLGLPGGQRRHGDPRRAAPHHGALGRGAAGAGCGCCGSAWARCWGTCTATT